MRVIRGWQLVFLKHLRDGQPEPLAARFAKVGLDKVLDSRNNDPEFDQKCVEAKRGYSYEHRVRW